MLLYKSNKIKLVITLLCFIFFLYYFFIHFMYCIYYIIPLIIWDRSHIT